MSKVEKIRAWAEKNYAKSYGAQVLIECFTDEELDAQFQNLRAAKEFADLKNEMYLNTQC